ncbi:hypothetical protein K2X83_01095 [Patescibacteria group bacterium]|nr:hypothetical protein [Patescibacteria group bacterium]
MKVRKRQEPIQPKLRLRDRRRKMLQIKIAAGVLVFLLLLGGVFFLARVPEVTVSKIEVEGTTHADPALVERIAAEVVAGSYGFLIPKRNALFVPGAEIEKKIAASFPVVKEAKVVQTSLTSVKVSISERTPSAVWCGSATETSPGECYFMDDGGYIYMTTAGGDAYVRYGGIIQENPVGQIFLAGGYNALNTFVTETGKTLSRTPESVFVGSNKDVSLEFVGGGELKFVMSEDSMGTLENIASVFASQKLKGRTEFEYADFRFGNKVYVKFKE